MEKRDMWKDVNVHPWRGENYGSPTIFPFRTLILGESNYTEAEKFDENLVINCVRDDIGSAGNRDTKGFCKFSTKIRRVIFGRHTEITPCQFWSNAAFYNFVQYLVGSKSKERPTAAMWKGSSAAFFEVLSVLRPERILVLGKGNWNNLLSNISHVRIDETTASISVDGCNALAGYIFHPSSGRGFSYQRWQPVAERVVLGHNLAVNSDAPR